VLATGGSEGTRTLYTTTEETMEGGARPVFLTGLKNTITRADLASRGVIIQVPEMKADQRRTEHDLWSQFYRDRPKIFGALLDLMVHALERQQRITDWKGLGRMADFHQWGIAVETKFAPAGTFERAYRASMADAIDTVLDADPFASGTVAFVEHLAEQMTEYQNKVDKWKAAEAKAKGKRGRKPKAKPKLRDGAFGGKHPAEGCIWGDGETQTVGMLFNAIKAYNGTQGPTEAKVATDPDFPKAPRAGHAIREAESTLHRKGIAIMLGKQHSRKRTQLVTVRLIERPDATYTEAEKAAAAAGDPTALFRPEGNVVPIRKGAA